MYLSPLVHSRERDAAKEAPPGVFSLSLKLITAKHGGGMGGKFGEEGLEMGL